MAPPAKRRKRNVVQSSPTASPVAVDTARKTPDPLIDPVSSPIEESSPYFKSSYSALSHAKSPTKDNAKAPTNPDALRLPDRQRAKRPTTKSASTSPEKTKAKVKTPEKSRSGNLFSFFSNQVQRQKSDANGADVRTSPPRNVQDHNEDISDDDEVTELKAQEQSIVGAAAKKRSRNVESLEVGASQKFLKISSFKQDIRADNDTRPWADRFAPLSLDELAVHKKKVTDVRAWLESVLEGRVRQRLLVLKGAAGTGKTTTIQLLCKAMDCDILEWRNPVGSTTSADGIVSMAAQFEEFIGRGGKFGQLDLFSDQETPSESELPLDRRKTVILVEEFPNTFTRSSSALQSFRSSILQYLTSNTPSLSMMYNTPKNTEPIIPLIMVISETLLTTTSASADSFTAHRLLGSEVSQHPGVTVIEFNAIAPTLLAKALELVVIKESRKSGRRKTPGPLVLRRLGEIGDIRSAIGSLEFLCIRGDDDGDWGSKVNFGKAKKGSKESVALTKMEEESLELVTRREASLGIFHAVGKVVYNKRDEASKITAEDSDVEALPEFLSLMSRPRRSQVHVDDLIDEIGTDTQTFIAALHENYVLSCDAPPLSDDFSDMDHVNGCIDALSDSDLLSPSWDGSFNPTGFGGGTGGRGSGGDVLRQDEICFQIAVRGILFSLPWPVKRRAPAATGLRVGKGSEAFKMFYPTSLKLWRTREEIESTIDLWLKRLMNGEDLNAAPATSGAAAFAKLKPGSVETWKRPVDSDQDVAKTGKPKEDTKPLLNVGTSAKKEMLLERLPYMASIAKGRQGGSSSIIRDIEKVTAFTGIARISEEVVEDAEDKPAAEEWATDKPVEGESPQKKRPRAGRAKSNGLEAMFAQKNEKLYLSDDDIEDD